MSAGKKLAIAGGALALLWGLVAKAKPKVEPPVGPPKPPVEPPVEPPIEPPVEPPAVEPPKPAGNYVGSGWAWPYADEFPNERAFGLRLQQLGYFLNPAAPTWTILLVGTRNIVKQFQRDYNAVRLTIAQPPPKLGIDGLIGLQTLKALRRATQWSSMGKPWPELVASAKD